MPRHVSETWRDYLGPGALTTLLLSALVAILGLGIPVVLRLREVLRWSRPRPPEPADAIVVLGRELEGDAPTRVFRGRLDHAAALWRAQLAPVVVVTGGLTGRSTRTEADAGSEYLVAQGVPARVVVGEGRSRHTLENLYNTREDHRALTKILIVSDDLHLARARALALNLGFEVVCAAAPGAATRTPLARWSRALREAALLHWYLTGVGWSKLIGSQRLLSRVT